MAQIIIPTPLRKFTNNEARITVSADTVGDGIIEAIDQYPDLKQNVLDESGALRGFVRIYVGDEDINTLDKERTKIEHDSVISIIPAIAGGSK